MIINDTVVITGVSGFVGTNLALKLIHHGFNVIGLDIYDHRNRLAQSGLLDKKEFSFIYGNLTLEDTIYSINDNKNSLKVIIHLAALAHVDYSIQFPAKTIQNNIISTVNIAKFAANNNIPLIFSSSVEVYGGSENALFYTETDGTSPKSPYAASKVSCEAILRAFWQAYDLRYTTLRFTNIFGSWQSPDRLVPRIVSQALMGITVTVECGTYRDFVNIDDVCDIIIKLVNKDKHTNQIYNIASGIGFDNTDVIRMLDSIVPKLGYKLVNRKRNDGRGQYLLSDSKKIQIELERDLSNSKEKFLINLKKTVQWYGNHTKWLDSFDENIRADRNSIKFLTDVDLL